VSHILQHMVSRLLTSENTAALLRRARESYAERNAYLLTALTAEGIEAQSNVDGLNVWIPVSDKPGRVVEALARRGWAVRSGNDFAVADRPTPAIRVTTSTLAPGQATDFAADLASALHS